VISNRKKFISCKIFSNRENVLISEDGKIKICDFGSSKILDGNGKNTPYIVSRYYRAPELILCVTKYTTSIDMWGSDFFCFLFSYQ